MTFAIRNWARFQHYTKRHPPWIKLYHDLLDDDDFAALDHFTQLLYFKLLMAASRKDNRIPEDSAWMATELSLPRRHVQRSLLTLTAAGFIHHQDASDPASHRASNGASANASPSRAPAPSREVEVEVEVEQNPPTSNGVEGPAGRPDDELEALAELAHLAELRDMPQ